MRLRGMHKKAVKKPYPPQKKLEPLSFSITLMGPTKQKDE